jgi:hypothetical protein
MSLIKQTDVKNHLSPRYRTQIHVGEPVTQQPDATAGSSGFAKDFLAEHSFSAAAVATAEPVTGSIVYQTPTVSKGSAQV